MIYYDESQERQVNHIYKAYPYTEDGTQLPYVQLEETPQAIADYFKVQAAINPTVIVIDHMDQIVAKMENGKLIFPKVDKEIDFRT